MWLLIHAGIKVKTMLVKGGPGEVVFFFASFHPNYIITHQNVTMSELIKKFPKGHISILLYLIK